VLAVNFWDEPTSLLKRYVKKEKLKQRVLTKGSNVAEAYRVTMAPTGFWIDAKGVIVDTEVGWGGPASLNERTKILVRTHKEPGV